MSGHDGAHTHGSGGFDWRIAAVAGGIAVIGVSGGASGVFSGLETLLWWVAGVFLAAGAVVSAVVIRAVRRRTPDYVRSIHGPAQRDLEIDENQRLRREIRDTRATRLAIERQRLVDEAMRAYSVPPGEETGFLTRLPADYRLHGTATGRITGDSVWTAEVISDTPDRSGTPGHPGPRG